MMVGAGKDYHSRYKVRLRLRSGRRAARAPALPRGERAHGWRRDGSLLRGAGGACAVGLVPCCCRLACLVQICEFHLKAHVVQKDGRPHRFCQQVRPAVAAGVARRCRCTRVSARCLASRCAAATAASPPHPPARRTRSRALPCPLLRPPHWPVQCGKFQPLEDFDGDKRSCRARLDKHNARRRRQREMAHMLKKTGTIDEKARLRGCCALPRPALPCGMWPPCRGCRAAAAGSQPQAGCAERRLPQAAAHPLIYPAPTLPPSPGFPSTRPSLQLLIEKYGMSEEQLAPKLARLAKQGFTVKKSASGGSTAAATAASERTASVKGRGGAASTSGATSVQPGTSKEGGAAAGASSGGVGMAVSHGGTAAAAMAAAAVEAEHHAQTAAIVQQLAAQQQLQEAQMAAALQAQAKAQAAAALQAQAAAALGMPGGAPGQLDAAGMSLLLDDEFLDEVRSIC